MKWRGLATTTSLPSAIEGQRSARRWRAGTLLAVALLGLTGWGTDRVVRVAVREKLRADLRTVLDADVTALEMWLRGQLQLTSMWAGNEGVRAEVAALVAESRAASPDELRASPRVAALRATLAPVCEHGGFDAFAVVDVLSGRVLAGTSDAALGQPLLPATAALLARIRRGEPVVTVPFPSDQILPEPSGVAEPGRAAMIVGAPVRGGDGEIVAAVGFRFPPDRDFMKILSVARLGESGETYAFDDRGTMLSGSRFSEFLREAGLIPPDADRSALAVELRDPGGDLTAGYRTDVPRKAQPLIRSVAAAIDGVESADVDGFRDYRGVEVVSAWRWLPEYGFGMATQVDAAEAFQLHRVARAVFGSLFGLLVLVSLGGLAVSHLVMRLRHQVDRAEHLGAYTLERKLGEGGMGEVYLGRHALLRRPTAIKLLRPTKASEAAIARFEREVQHSSQLTHPNTIGIYDYGRTPDGTFYYAMEYIEGFTLAALVSRFGPLPEARVIHILRQVCGSLAEAHERGLVHRDVKPANVMLAARGGLYDHVKVLDFGLVREQAPRAPTPPTAEAGAVAGTPLYMPPEAFQCPDDVSPRGDLYALGALAYYLLTGVPPFTAPNPFALYERHRREVPKPPSEVLGRKVDGVLEALVLACLEKSASQRPADAGRLASLLEASPLHGAWTQAQAREWWERHGAELARSAVSTSPDPTSSASATHGPEGTVMLARRPEAGASAGVSR